MAITAWVVWNLQTLNQPLRLTCLIAGQPKDSERARHHCGQHIANPLTDYLVAAYPNEIDVSDVHYITSTFSVTFSGFISTTGVASVVHIDIIAEAGNTTATGYPWCDMFVVTWDGNVNAAMGSLNSLSLTSLMPPIPGGEQLDVAAIQRLVGGSVHNIALLAYTIVGATQPNMPNMTLLLHVHTRDTARLFTNIFEPRIDAPDDYNINGTTIPSQSYYKNSCISE